MKWLLFYVFLPFCLVLGCSDEIVAQEYTKEIKQQFVDAEYFLIGENYEKALQLYKNVNTFDPNNYNVIYRIGLCYLNMPFMTDESIKYLEKAITAINPKYNEGSYKETKADPDALFYLGSAYQLQYRFDDAVKMYTQYKSLLDVKKLFFINQVDRQIASCRYSQEVLKAPATVAFKNVGSPVNTNKQSNFNPCLSADDSVLIYARSIPHKVYDEMLDAQVIKMHNRIMECHKTADGWSTPVDISMQLKSEGTSIPISLSPDGKSLYLFRDNSQNAKSKEKDKGVLYVSSKLKNKWSPMERLPGVINTLNSETHACMSTDGQTVYFTSDKKDGSFGGKDIYSVVKVNDSTWGQPQNLGETINTSLHEESPFVVNDDLLFFCSEGHNTMGGYDLFYSRKTASGWTEPINMRPPINTPDDELFFVPVLNGHRIYRTATHFDSSKTNQPIKEIYSFDISLDEGATKSSKAPNEKQVVTRNASDKSSSVISIVGLISSSDNKPLQAPITVVIRNAETKQELSTLHPDYQNGSYSASLPTGVYLIEIDGAAYTATKQVFFIPANQSSSVIFSSMLIPKAISTGKYACIKTFYFNDKDISLTREAKIELERINAMLQENPSLKAEIIGYRFLNNKFNSAGAAALADSIINYLSTDGIETNHLLKTSADASALALSPAFAEIRLLRTDDMKIVTNNLNIPDELTYKDYIRYSVMVSKGTNALSAEEQAKYKAAGLPKMEVLHVQDQYFYYSGDCKNKADAIVLLNKVHDAGFEHAEITDYFKTNRLTTIQSASKPTAATKTSAALAMDEEEEPSIAPQQWFTIQLCALNKPDDTFKKDDRVLVYRCKDGQYRYVYGIYLSLDEAKADLHKAIEWGFADAFVAQGSRYNELECECNR